MDRDGEQSNRALYSGFLLRLKTDRDHPENIMEMKSTAPQPSPPAYSSIMPYPGPQNSSYGYPHPATSVTPNHPVAPPTTEIGSGEVHTVKSNHEPSTMVVVHKYEHPHPKLQFWISVGSGLLFAVVAIFMLVKIIGFSSEMDTIRNRQSSTFFPKGVLPSW